MGRPSSYSEEIAELLCEEIAKGAALYRLCEERDDLPAERTVYQWLEKSPEFAQRYARARDRQQDREIDHCVVIADTAKDANLARVQIDARKWRASKLAPKKYGDKLDLEHSGSVKIEAVARTIVDPVQVEQSSDRLGADRNIVLLEARKAGGT